jgi:putative ABC transport system ATP-binding protein
VVTSAAVPTVEVQGLTHRYGTPGGTLTVLDDLGLTVAEGEHVAIIGPSGSGKSTLLALIGGLDRPQMGTVRVAGQDLSVLRRDQLAQFRARTVGFVFQHFGLLDSLTAVENVELAGTLAGSGKRARRRDALALLGAVGLAGRAHQPPATLSGGERQRVAIVRALMNRPQLVLADEPTGNLDAASAGVVADLLHSTTTDQGSALVIVTHDPAMAARADRVLELRAGRFHQTTAVTP